MWTEHGQRHPPGYHPPGQRLCGSRPPAGRLRLLERRLGRLESRALTSLRRLGPLALELVWPTRCAGCERMGTLLCDECAEALPRIEQASACPRCGAPAGRLVCTECTPVYGTTAFSFVRACCALEFSELTRRVILAYKDGGERRLAPLLAGLIAEVIPFEWRRWADALTWIPADSQALKRRGFDHMGLIARELAPRVGLCAQPLLVKQAHVDQRGLGRAQRADNARAIFHVRHSPATPAPRKPQESRPPRQLLLIDDVLTTGATLDAAARALLSAGAREVRAATIARVW